MSHWLHWIGLDPAISEDKLDQLQATINCTVWGNLLLEEVLKMEKTGDHFHVCYSTITVILQDRVTQIVTNPIMVGSGQNTKQYVQTRICMLTAQN